MSYNASSKTITFTVTLKILSDNANDLMKQMQEIGMDNLIIEDLQDQVYHSLQWRGHKHCVKQINTTIDQEIISMCENNLEQIKYMEEEDRMANYTLHTNEYGQMNWH